MRRTAAVLFCALTVFLAWPRPCDAAQPSIASGGYRSCAVNRSGGVVCWGDNTTGSLGTGDALYQTTATALTRLAPGVASIAAGAFHTCAVDSAGAAWCWGENANGQLGTGTIDSSSIPAPVAGLSSGIVQIAPAAWHTCALNAVGGVLCWGFNLGGELGYGGANDAFTPVNVAGLASGATSIASGEAHTCALLAGGEVRCWGDNGYGQLGDGTQQGRRTPVAVTGLPPARSISAGLLQTCAVTQAGAAMCWGRNDFGQLGNGSTTDSSVPVVVSGLSSGVRMVAAAAFHACALLVDGSVRCWGDNSVGRLGNGAAAESLVPSAVLGLPSDVTAIVSGGISSHTCATSPSRGVLCWGYNAYGQIGDGTTTDRLQAVVSTAAGPAPSQVVAGADHTCALSAGIVSCWGANTSYQLGDGKMVGIPTPTPVVGLASGAIQVSSGNFHGCAVKESGEVACWGESGTLGDGTTVGSSVPVGVTGISDAVSVVTGGFHSCALRRSGRVSCWGLNDNGQLGDGTQRNAHSPVDVSGLPAAIVQLAAGEVYTCALSAAGAVYCWGGDDSGQTTGTTTSVPIPAWKSGIRSIAAGASHTCALTTSGGVQCIGDNGAGELGNGSTLDSQAPVAVTSLASGVSAISVGKGHSCALTNAGAVLCWGYNGFGQLGDGTIIDRTTPVQVAGLASGVIAIAAGGYHTCAMLAAGDVRCWGYNSAGAAGDGTFAVRTRPAVVLRERGTGSIAGGDWFLHLDPSLAATIPAADVPPYLATATGNTTTAVVNVSLQVRYRPEDAGRTIYIYGYVPSSIVSKKAAKDGSRCTLVQLSASGVPQAATSDGLQGAIGNVVTSQQQSVQLINNVAASQIAGGTFCTGVGTTGAEASNPSNSRCAATIPSSGTLCLPPDASAVASVPGVLSGLWWNPQESGWGVSFTQRRNIVFAAWYTYDTAGAPKWYVASNCSMPAASASGTCTGTLYEVHGPAFLGVPFNASAVTPSSVGTLQVSFADANVASMAYTVNGETRSVPIVRQVFGPTDTPPAVDYTDLWWNPAESGWGVSITQQYKVMFLAWFVYDGGGHPVWYVASDCAVQGEGCSGTLYRTSGPPFGPTFNASLVKPAAAGTVSATFTDPNNGILRYTVDGVTASKAITREIF